MRPDASTLPCASRVVAHVLDACASGDSEFSRGADWAALDPGLATQLLDLAYSLPGLTDAPAALDIDQVFSLLGPARIRPLANRAAMEQLFSRAVAQADYRNLWQDAVRLAHLSQLIAQRINYARPTEAYLAGLLSNVGQFCLLREFSADYAGILRSAKTKAELLLLEKSCFGLTHVEAGEQMVRRWNADSFIADAIRFQHYPSKAVQGAHALVVICNFALRLADPSNAATALPGETDSTFGIFSIEDMAQMRRDADATAEQAARELGLSNQLEPGVDAGAGNDLYRQMRDQLLVSPVPDIADSESCPLLRYATRLRVVVGLSTPHFFMLRDDKKALRVDLMPGQNALVTQLEIAIPDGASLVARSFQARQVLHSFDQALLPGRTVLDEQICRFAGASGIACVPLVDRQQACVGVAVIGVEEAQTELIAREAKTLLRLGVNVAEELVSTAAPARAATSTVEAKAEYDESDKWYRYLVENSPDIVYTLDQDGKFRYLSNRIESLLGYNHAELIGKDYSVLLHEEDRDRAKFAFNERRSGTRATFGMELRLRRADGMPAANDDYITIELNSMGMYVESNNGGRGSFAGTYGVARDISDRKRNEETIRHQAYHDALTGLPNRALFTDRLNVAIALARRSRQSLAVMFLDLDRFKSVNDTMGHQVGDQLLQSVARGLANCLRRGDTLSRFGGDEFTLLLPQISDRDAAADTARKLLAVLAYPFVVDGQEQNFGASIGIAVFPDDGDQVDDLIKCADNAMYRVKQRERNNFAFYDEADRDEVG
jgi:diguanylate cyclase (GGDEF)-like protein/PAS domain S-box-containing protein